MKCGKDIQVLTLKNRAGNLDPERRAVVQAISQLERRIFPKHESLSSNVLQEVERRNCCVLYSLGEVPGNQDGVVVGYIMFTCASLVASVTKLAVKENCRRSGYGEALLRTAIEHIRQRKLHYMNLHVDTTREPAISLYTKLGFKVDAVVHSYYAPNRDAYRMCLSVDDIASC
eukprot:TRINITY_DN7034_c0_g1_i1.p1 TRINITY_DN7034_c0_g1~~TRINITY_DN7034_c0_g1_i1.p1  ORF type:complete len:173 (-),score=15.06 TRINITY_DN7034_c0_g1_i1:99-617(-)